MIWTTKNAHHGIDVYKIESAVMDHVMVPADSNPNLAYEYDMLPNQEVGGYIDKLNNVISGENRMLTKEQAQQIMLITLAGVLYGMRQYYENTENIKLTEYLRKDDDLIMQKNLGCILKFLDEPGGLNKEDGLALRDGIAKFCWLGGSYEHICGDKYNIGYDCYRKPYLSVRDSVILSKFYTKSNGDENSLLFVDFGKMLSRHTHPQYDSRNSIWDGKYAGRRVLQMCDLIGAVKNMGEEYVIAPAFNLYANAVLRNASDYKRFISK